MQLVLNMNCKECGSESFARNGGWEYCRKCGRIVDVDYVEAE